jgi:hypothetical protein
MLAIYFPETSGLLLINGIETQKNVLMALYS